MEGGYHVMSRTIDEKVLEMRFDNTQFEKNVHTSMSTLDKLKQSLNLTGASKGLENVSSAARNVNMSGLSSAVENVSSRFSALEVMGVTALANITNSAVNAGKRMISALTIDPIKTGFNEYETKINAIQTIMSNTASKGTTMADVTKVIDELNTYADKTIYNFAEMTRNIGTFTAAGVGLEDSAAAIQGIANLAAASGSNSQQAATAMYQLSQALASGTVKLMDWNSVVNAGMGGQKFQDALKATAREHGIAVDDIIKKQGSFRESLSEGWLSADILNETLKKFTVEGAKEYAKSMVDSGKWTQAQADALIKEAQAMEDAATKVKTFTQLIDTLKESLQSGWGKTWELIFGDFEEAKDLFTEISDTLGAVINKSGDARNEMLQSWKDLGGRTALVDSLRNSFEAISSIVKPISEAFREIFPPITAKQLYNFTLGLKNLTEKLKLSDETADKLKRTFKGVFSIFDIFGKVLTSVAKVIGSLFTSGSVSGVLDLILTLTATIGDFFTSINEGFSMNAFTNIFSGIAEVIGKAIQGVSNFGDVFSNIGSGIGKVLNNIWEGIKTVFSWITDNISAGDIFAGLAGGGIFMAAKKLMGLFEKLKEVAGKGILGLIFGTGDGNGEAKPKLGEQFSNVLGSVHESLQAFTSGIKIASLIGIASAIAILSAALKTISEIKAANITKSLFAIGTMLGMLTGTFTALSKSLSKFPAKGIVKASFSTMLIAEAINILASAMETISELSLGEVVKGLIGIGGGMAALAIGIKAINKVKIKVSTSLAIVVLANSLKTLAEALTKFGSMSWKEIKRGLTAMGGALTEFVVTLKALEKVSGLKSLAGSAGLVLAVQSLDEISENLKKFGEMSWSEIRHGLNAMGGALTELVAAISILGKTAGFSSLLGAGSILIVSKSLGDIAEALAEFSYMSWGEIGRGLIAMGGALTEISVITGALGKLAGLSGLLGAGTILLAVQSLDDIADALQELGFMTWDEIKRGLVGMSGALSEIGIVTGALGKLAGLSGLLGAGSMLLAVQGLGDIADALKKFGSMTWDEIKRGLVGMGGALTEIGVITGLLGTFAGLPSLLGSGSILVAVQGLGDIADALKKFGEMSWDEIKKGLTAMGAALGELALGGLLNTLSVIGSMSISNVAEPLGVLADSVKKWTGVIVPPDLAFQLTNLAYGIRSFTFDGLGASALATAAPAMGIMADSVKKWTGVSVPENLGTQLGTLASGIRSFTFDGLGASALATAAPGIGTMADSVKKWSGVTVPEDLESQLGALAKGIKAFSFAFLGGWSLETIVGPLGKLASSVKKWNGVTVPENIGDQLKKLAKGAKAFSFAFLGGWSLDTITGPLGKLAGSVKKWNGVTVPENIGEQLKRLADALKSFSGVGDISNGTNGISSIAKSATTLSGVNFISITSGLNSLSDSFGKLASSGSSISGLGQSIVDNIIKPIQGLDSKFVEIGSKAANSLAKGMKSNSAVTSAANSIISSATKALGSKSSAFKNAGAKMGTMFANGIKSKTSNVVSAVKAMVNAASNALSGKYNSFYTAGSNVAKGFANGISANQYLAVAKAKAMAEAAEKAAKKILKINSPSKVFRKIGSSIPEGFAMGIEMFGSAIKGATISMANNAMDNTKKAISRIGTLLNSDMDVQPTIRPVMDLSNVRSGVGAINGMLSMQPSIGVSSNISAINTMMNRRNQNGNSDVVSAIDGLRKDINSMDNPTYNINGISYSDGTDVSDAIKTLVRAAKVERRV